MSLSVWRHNCKMGRSTLTLDDLSFEEQTAVAQLKQRMVGLMKPEMYDDLSVFVRFLRARDLNINAAEAMLKNHLEWRKINQTDTILTDFTAKEVVKKYLTVNSLGIDRDGVPLLYFHIGGVDPKGILRSCRKIDVMKYIVYILEENVVLLRKQSQLLGKHLDKWTMILNFDGLSFGVATHKETLDIIGSLITMYEANYPERLKTAFLINSSIYFTMAFRVVKVFLSGPTYRKIRVFSRESWQEEVLKAVDPTVLPAFLGGTRTDPDGNPLCLSAVTHGGPVHESYFVTKKASQLATSPGVEKLTVSRKSKVQLTLDVTERGSHIEWEFETKKWDIGFSLHYKSDKWESRKTELIPKQRIDTNMCSETGMYKCDKLGIYIIEFDNSYSWFHQKEVYYKISLIQSPLIM